MEQTNPKTNFWKDIFKSIKDLDKYEDFALEAPKKAMKYFLKLLLVFCMVIAIFYTYRIVQNLNDMYSNLKEVLPDFQYENGELHVFSEEPVIIEDYMDSLGKILIDTREEETITKEYSEEKEAAFLLKNKMMIFSRNSFGQVSYQYRDLANQYNISNFTKQDLVNYVESMNKLSICASIYLVIFVYLFIIYFISIFMDVLLLSALAWIVSRISRIRLKYAPSFGIAIHAITLPVILNLIYIVVNLLTGFHIQYFQLMYNTISYIYVIVAILMIKTDFINRQVELIKLAQEQEKIKEELKRKEEEEKQKQEENQKPKKEDKPQKKEKKKKQKEEDKDLGADAPAFKEVEPENK